MPITINGIPLVVAGQVNRHVIGAVVHDGSLQTHYQLHPQALQMAVARDSPSPIARPDPDITLAVRTGVRR